MRLCQVAGQTHFRVGKGAHGPGSQPHQTVSLAQTQAQGQVGDISHRPHAASLGRSASPHPDVQPGRGPSGSPVPSAWSHRAQASKLSTPFSVHGWQEEARAKARVPRPGEAVGKNKQALGPQTRHLSAQSRVLQHRVPCSLGLGTWLPLPPPSPGAKRCQVHLESEVSET